MLLDFGRHLVGRLTLRLDAAGSHQDAPAFIRLDFAEMPGELTEKDLCKLLCELDMGN